MKNKRFARRLRQRLAPAGSRADRLWHSFLRRWQQARQASLTNVALRLLPGALANPLRRALRRRRLSAAAPVRLQAQEIANAMPSGQMIIFPPSLDWFTQLFQRPQQLALAFARQGVRVFYLQPRPDASQPAFQQIQPGLYLCNTPLEAFADFIQPTIYLLTWNRSFFSAFNDPQVIYDYVDEIQVFEGNYAEMVRDHEKLVRSARLVVTTAQRLHQHTIPMRPDALLCPNGVEYEHFVRARRPSIPADGQVYEPPADLAPTLASGKPVIGYYGALAAWFDYPLLESLCLKRPDLEFVLIGPDYDGTLPPRLLELPNLRWLGVKTYAELPGYLRYFDVATIPFQVNEITHSTSPLKLFEYMAGGKPVVITPMHESQRTPGVLVAKDAVEFSAQIDRALQLRNDPDYLALLEQTARQNTWDARARQILETLISR